MCTAKDSHWCFCLRLRTSREKCFAGEFLSRQHTCKLSNTHTFLTGTMQVHKSEERLLHDEAALKQAIDKCHPTPDPNPVFLAPHSPLPGRSRTTSTWRPTRHMLMTITP